MWSLLRSILQTTAMPYTSSLFRTRSKNIRRRWLLPTLPLLVVGTCASAGELMILDCVYGGATPDRWCVQFEFRRGQRVGYTDGSARRLDYQLKGPGTAHVLLLPRTL